MSGQEGAERGTEMKKAVCIVICLLALLGGCGKKKQVDLPQGGPEAPAARTVTFVNEVKDADVWILPQTEKNLKTTVWGTATLSGVSVGESRQAPLCEPGDDGLYMFRMIDTGHFYYSANGIVLKAGWTARLRGDDLYSYTLEVTDETGAVDNTYEVFSARL